jgi:lipoprotein Spr
MLLVTNKLPAQLICFILISHFVLSCRSGKNISHSPSATPASKKIEKKYSEILGVSQSDISNTDLYLFIDEWYGVPYEYGGKNKNGIDCSNFTSTLYKTVYRKAVSGSSSAIFKQCQVVSKEDLKEGDLLFFKIEKDEISHIGVFLQNNKFVHATTKKGVMIDDLNEPYYKKYFFKAGRIN